MTPSSGIEPGLHWWEERTLTTAPTLLPQDRFQDHQEGTSLAFHSTTDLITRVVIALIQRLDNSEWSAATVKCSC